MIHNKYIKIMKPFLRGYNKEIYGRELVGKVNLSQKNIALTLDELEGFGILSSKKKGNLRHYFLNKKNPLILKYLVMFELGNSIEFFEIHKKINLIFDKIDLKADIVCVFGSYAKGLEKEDSDIDLFVAGKFDEEKVKNAGELFNLKISVKRGTMSDFARLMNENNPLINEIIENHVVLSGYERFVGEVTRQRW